MAAGWSPAGQGSSGPRMPASSSGVQGLLLHQLLGHALQDRPVMSEHRPGPAVGLVDQPADLPVDGRGHLLGVVGLVAEVASEEDLPAGLPELLRAQGCRSCRTP